MGCFPVKCRAFFGLQISGATGYKDTRPQENYMRISNLNTYAVHRLAGLNENAVKRNNAF
jgi:hypothetical protein